MHVSEIARQARQAALALARLPEADKNQALAAMADALEQGMAAILAANARDMEAAKRDNLAAPLVARLAINENKVRGMAAGVRSVGRLPDPVGRLLRQTELDEGLILSQVSCPIGVIGAIFESRPDAVPQIASLCLKSGNAVILKGGSEAQHSNKVLVDLLSGALATVPGVPRAAVQMIETRAEVAEMLKEEENINLVVPRGSNAFVKYIQDNTRIPVLGHAEGICHGYIDAEADLELAVKVALDSKIQYPAACNAMETLLIHQDIAAQALPRLVREFRASGVEPVGCLKSVSLVPDLARASEEDWDTEYNDLRLSIRIVSDLGEAIEFINAHGSGHTDVILTEDAARAERFQNEVDSASVLWNASTRFADGFRFGLGAESGISTNKSHARGPVGLEGLVIYKYKLAGRGHTVAEYSGDQARPFTHRPLYPKPAR